MWRGSIHLTVDLISISHFQALDMLGTYLTSGPVAPLNKEYVEIENPLWSVHHSMHYNRAHLYFS